MTMPIAKVELVRFPAICYPNAKKCRYYTEVTHPLSPSAFPTVVRTVEHDYACQLYLNTESTLQLFLDMVFNDTWYYHCHPARWLHRSCTESSNQHCMC